MLVSGGHHGTACTGTAPRRLMPALSSRSSPPHRSLLGLHLPRVMLYYKVLHDARSIVGQSLRVSRSAIAGQHSHSQRLHHVAKIIDMVSFMYPTNRHLNTRGSKLCCQADDVLSFTTIVHSLRMRAKVTRVSSVHDNACLIDAAPIDRFTVVQMLLQHCC